MAEYVVAVSRIIDSGAGIHLKSICDDVVGVFEGEPVALATANGVIHASMRSVENTQLGPITSLLVEDSPEVLSLGRLVRENGVSFYGNMDTNHC
jgi:hypothetical protein